MSGVLRPTVRTTPTRLDFAIASIRAREGMSRESFAVLWAQFCAETGYGRNCYNFNVGNVKWNDGSPFDYVALHVWEGVSATTFEQMRRAPFGECVRLDPDESHQKAVGSERIAVAIDPPHPATRFRAYDSLEIGLYEHVRFLETHYPSAWAAALDGDVVAFGRKLGAAGYYTASPDAYVANMRRPYDDAIVSDDFEHAIALLKDEDVEKADTVAQPVVYALPDPPARDD